MHLKGEVHVSWRVQDVDAVRGARERPSPRLPGGGGGRRGDGDAALLLLLHPVHLGGARVHLAHRVDAAGEVEDALGERGHPRVERQTLADEGMGGVLRAEGVSS